MAYYDALITKWATLTGTTEQKLAQVNAFTVAGPMVDVSVGSVISYLALNAKLSNLVAYAGAPPTGASPTAIVAAKELIALFNMPAFTEFFLSQPSVYATVQVFLNALASDTNTGISSADATALLALGATTTPWWTTAYTSPISHTELEAAGGLT